MNIEEIVKEAGGKLLFETQTTFVVESLCWQWTFKKSIVKASIERGMKFTLQVNKTMVIERLINTVGFEYQGYEVRGKDTYLKVNGETKRINYWRKELEDRFI